MGLDRCRERMSQVEKDGECITEHPGYAACSLNTWVLPTATIGLKTKAKNLSYSTTKTKTNAAESTCMLEIFLLLFEFIKWEKSEEFCSVQYTASIYFFPWQILVAKINLFYHIY